MSQPPQAPSLSLALPSPWLILPCCSPKVPSRDIPVQCPSLPLGGSSCSQCLIPITRLPLPPPISQSLVTISVTVAAIGSHSLLLEPDRSMVSMPLSSSGLLHPLHSLLASAGGLEAVACLSATTEAFLLSTGYQPCFSMGCTNSGVRGVCVSRPTWAEPSLGFCCIVMGLPLLDAALCLVFWPPHRAPG